MWLTFDPELAHSSSGCGSNGLLPVMWWSSPWWRFIYSACAAFVGSQAPPSTAFHHHAHLVITGRTGRFGSDSAGCEAQEDWDSVSLLLVHHAAHFEHQSHCCSLHWILLLLDRCHTANLHLESIIVHRPKSTSWLRPRGTSVTLDKLLATAAGSSIARCSDSNVLLKWRMCDINTVKNRRKCRISRKQMNDYGISYSDVYFISCAKISNPISTLVDGKFQTHCWHEPEINWSDRDVRVRAPSV